MITKIIDENSISIIPEDSDDLLNLRRIIKEDDKIIGDTTRVLKQDKDYSMRVTVPRKVTSWLESKLLVL